MAMTAHESNAKASSAQTTAMYGGRRIDRSMFPVGPRRQWKPASATLSRQLLLFAAGLAMMGTVNIGAAAAAVSSTEGGLRHKRHGRGSATHERDGGSADESSLRAPPMPETGLRMPRRERHRLLQGAGGGGFGGGGGQACTNINDGNIRETLRASSRRWVLSGGCGAESAGRLTHQTTSLSPQFPSGKWRGYYRQYGRDHSLFHFDLHYGDPVGATGAAGTLSGSGSDDVGQYTIEGLYDRRSGRMALTKQYIQGTGNPAENKGHSVYYRGAVSGCLAAGIRGRWDVITSGYCDNGAFHLWPEFRSTAVSTYESTPKLVSSLSVSPSLEILQGATTVESIPLLCGGGSEAHVAFDYVAINGDDEEGECAVCFDERVDTILRPCGHIVICATCARVLDWCPICRKRIDSFSAYEYGRRRGRKGRGDGFTAVLASAGKP